MKYRLPFLLLTLFGLISFAVPAHAATPLKGTPLNGTAYGENIGLIYFDYKTAEKPAGLTIDAGNYDTYYIGPRKQFYINKGDINYTAVSDPTLIATISNIGDLNEDGSKACDLTNWSCPLHGFLWSDTIGWIILDGSEITKAIASFQADSYARAKFTFPPPNDKKALLMGYIWSEKTGWIQLSDGSGNLPPATQTAASWGVWMDASLSAPINDMENKRADCTKKKNGDDITDETGCQDKPDECQWDPTVDSDPSTPGLEGACMKQPIRFGRALYGNAWSEKLGWIKFGKEAGEFNELGVYTMWMPDTTPPVFNVDQDNLWFANRSPIGTISWPGFATDPESGIDSTRTKIAVVKNASPGFSGCPGTTVDCDAFAKDPCEANAATCWWDNANGACKYRQDLLNKNIDVGKYPQANDLIINLPRAGLVTGAASYGFCMYTLSGEIVNGAGLKTAITPKTFYTRAGDLVPNQTKYTRDTAACPEEAIADGKDCLKYIFEAFDIASLPVVSVKAPRAVNVATLEAGGYNNQSADWMRKITSIFYFDSNIHYDAILKDEGFPSYTLPVKLTDNGAPNALLLQDASEPIVQYGLGGAVAGKYPVIVSSYAPTSFCGTECENSFKLVDFSLKAEDATMPAITKNDSPLTGGTTEIRINSNLQIFLFPPLSFKPALTASAANLEEDFLIPAKPNSATFTLKNQSALSSIEYIDLDHDFRYTEKPPGGSGLSAVLDVREINLANEEGGDSVTGRTDPVMGKTRYETFQNASTDASSTIFHDANSNFHDPYIFINKVIAVPFTLVPASCQPDGTYEIDKIYDLPGQEDNITIDRSDLFDSSAIALTGTKTYQIDFTPQQFVIPENSDQMVFGIKQYIGYRLSTPEADERELAFTIYPPDNLIQDIEVKNIGVQYTGLGTGEKIYKTGEKTYESVGKEVTRGFKEQIRRNIAELTTGLNLDGCTVPLSLGSLPTSGSCVFTSQTNQTVAIYDGTPDQILTLGTGADIELPSGQYTLILRGGTNLLIKNNLLYPDDSSYFGIILLASDQGEGANVYIHPDPTNINASVYAEGSLLSSPDGSQFYYGPGSLSANLLSNQLYWKAGTIASRNTIGGAANKKLPDGISCEGADYCFLLYDMDYIRRFTVDKGLTSGKFSGGGSCPGQSCSPATLGADQTTITLTNGIIDPVLSKSTDPFYIEKDNRSIAPPGFTITSGMTQSQEIRP